MTSIKSHMTLINEAHDINKESHDILIKESHDIKNSFVRHQNILNDVQF